MDNKLVEARLSESVVGAFYQVYNELGYGFLEHVHAKGMERSFDRAVTALHERRTSESTIKVPYFARSASTCWWMTS
jgi:hypothetical protein